MPGKKKLIDITDQEIEAIYDAGKETTFNFIRMFVDKINSLAETVEKQQKEIDNLKKIISKDSHNSNKPPSSDNPYKRKTKPLRKKGGKTGGQKGHKGTNLKQIKRPDIVLKIKINGNCECKRKLSLGKFLGYENKQVIDFASIKTETTEYQAEIRECKCGEIHTAKFPSGVKVKIQYGSNIKSLAVYLKHYGFMSYERIAEFMEDVAGLKISQGTLVNIINECADKLRPTVDRIKETLIDESIVHFDETSIRIEGSLHWLHSAGNKNLTYYFPHKKRGKLAMDAMEILPNFQGIAVHDHWDSYYQFIKCIHSLCNSHHLRELIFFEEQDEKWATKIKRCLIAAKKKTGKKNLLRNQKNIIAEKCTGY